MKTLMVDGQLWQTDAWYRGMGVYTRNLLTNYIKDADVKVLIVLNGNIETLPDRIKQIKQELQGAEIHYLDLPITALEDNRARRVLDDFIYLYLLLIFAQTSRAMVKKYLCSMILYLSCTGISFIIFFHPNFTFIDLLVSIKQTL
jgi:hypothetical protein